jgi:hypothetical protein
MGIPKVRLTATSLRSDTDAVRSSKGFGLSSAERLISAYRIHTSAGY